MTQKFEHFAIHSPPLAGILVEHNFVECVTNDAGLLTNIVIASIASTADHHATSLCRKIGDSLHQCFDGIWVVPVVGYDGGAFVVKHIETTWNTLDVTDKCCESFADGFPWDIDGPSGTDRSHRVFYLKGNGTTPCDWHLSQRNTNRVLPLHGNNMVVFDKQHAFTLCAMCCDDGMVGI